jgi:immunity protein, SdpI family
MTWDNILFSLLMLVGVIFFVTGLILQKFPAKKINNFYGYRTANSMKSQERWDFSQTFAAGQFIKSGAVLILLAIIASFFQFGETEAIVTGLLLMLIFTIGPIYKTEMQLKEKFGD